MKSEQAKGERGKEAKEEIECPECTNSMEQIDTTYSNTKTARCEVGQHTGDIYECKICKTLYIDNMLNGQLESWSY